MNTIRFDGQKWKLHTQTPTKLVFVPDGNPLKSWREKNKLNQRAAADRLGISQTHVAKIESGTRTCPPELFGKLNEKIERR